MDTLLTVSGHLCGTAWRARRFLVPFVGVGVLITVGVSLLWPPTYRASTLLIPNQSAPGLSGTLSQFSSLAGQFGLSTGGEDPARIFPEILRSRALAHTILRSRVIGKDGSESQYLDHFNIAGGDSADRLEKATKDFQEKRSRIILNPKNSSIKIVVYDRDPSVAAIVANSMASELDRMNQEINRSNARERRKFIENRREEVMGELRGHEEELRAFREGNRQYTSSPQLMLEFERLSRRVRLDEEVYLTLTRELELAKIDEVKDVPVINVIDRALPAASPHRPGPMLIIASSILISGLVGLFLVLAWEGRQRLRHAFETRSAAED